MLRLIDLFSSLFGLLLLFPVMLIITIIGFFDTGSPIFIQERVGRNNKTFRLIKFRTMEINTKSVGTHEVNANAITKLGAFLRKTKLDELPQLVNVTLGQMSLVGARPCLPNQIELIKEREARGVLNHRPGITGLAQINSVDMSKPRLLAKVDALMLKKMNLCFYFFLILKTITGSGSGDRVST